MNKDNKDLLNELIKAEGIVEVLKNLSLAGFTRTIEAKLSEDKDDKNPKQFSLNLQFDNCTAFDLSSAAAQHYRIAWQNNTRKKSGWKQLDRFQDVKVSPTGIAGGVSMEDVCANILGKAAFEAYKAKGISTAQIYSKIQALLGEIDLDDSGESDTQ
jgi:hypothetical protein